METESPRSKVDAIYKLRDAVEAKVHAEQELLIDGSAAARDVLLEAQIEVEAKTQDAIEVCHECGHSHTDDEAHVSRVRVSGRHDNVVHVDFRPDRASAERPSD
jgi:hypothetical protein